MSCHRVRNVLTSAAQEGTEAKVGVNLRVWHYDTKLFSRGLTNPDFRDISRLPPFILIISPVFLMLALFGTAGSAAWGRTQSLVLAVIAGVWCAMVAILIALCVAFWLNLAFEGTMELQLHEAFAASRMNDPEAFLVKNMLEATSEGLVRMPIFAVFLSFIGAVTNAWISGASRRMALAAICLTPFMFVAGAAALWHADSLTRAARPPFVMIGVVLAGVALCGAHPIWSVLRRTRQA